VAAFTATVPPRHANRFALSRSISARRASWSRAVRSSGPASWRAFSSSSPSRLMAVRRRGALEAA